MRLTPRLFSVVAQLPSKMATPIAIIAGVGPGTGASVARKFAASYTVVLMARNAASYEPLVSEIQAAGGKAVGISADVIDPNSMNNAFGKIKEEFAEAKCAAAVFNVGGGFLKKPFLELTQGEFEAGWRSNGRGAFLFSQGVLPLLLNSTDLKYPPTLIFTGATAAIKGSAQLSAFSTGKFALRSLTQSLSKEFGPRGIHVTHAIIDGIIDIEKTKSYKLDQADAKIDPNAIADAYWHLHTQPRTAFSNEIDIRPYVEKW